MAAIQKLVRSKKVPQASVQADLDSLEQDLRKYELDIARLMGAV